MDSIKILNINQEGYADIEITIDEIVYAQSILGVPVNNRADAEKYIKDYAKTYKQALIQQAEAENQSVEQDIPEKVVSLIGKEITL